jgi:PHD/YefM family antitoxin component YafN of YafNO toxin-antitoxin module
MLSQEDWNAIEETLYLNSIPNMASSIQKAMNADDSEFSENIEW